MFWERLNPLDEVSERATFDILENYVQMMVGVNRVDALHYVGMVQPFQQVDLLLNCGFFLLADVV